MCLPTYTQRTSKFPPPPSESAKNNAISVEFCLLRRASTLKRFYRIIYGYFDASAIKKPQKHLSNAV